MTDGSFGMMKLVKLVNEPSLLGDKLRCEDWKGKVCCDTVTSGNVKAGTQQPLRVKLEEGKVCIREKARANIKKSKWKQVGLRGTLRVQTELGLTLRCCSCF